MVEYYYSILNLGLQKKRGDIITDELVKKHYDECMKRCLEQGIKLFGNEENLQEHIAMLKEAYRAIGTENARRYTDELIAMIEEHRKTRNLEKQKNIEPKTRKVDTDKGKISNLKTAMQNMSKSPDTKEILKQIKEKAQKEHPIPEEWEL